jgi:site-specific DNA-methyltransferase (adenine-specific)
MLELNKLYLLDCIEGMKQFPDKYFDLAIVDPPYGIKEDGKSNHSRSKLAKAKEYTPKNWDNETPSNEYFDQLFRVSKNQIIWGGNYFLDKIQLPTSCMIVWDKDNGESDFADCELAWSSFKSAVRRFKFRWAGMLQENMKDKELRIHPTQKPVQLYKWLLQNYAKEGDKIIDTHVGSASSIIAFEDGKFDYVGFEIDEEYFNNAQKRIQQFKSQIKIF